MSATYFSPALFSRAKKHTEDLAKTNPAKPVLNDEDEKFLERITSDGDKGSSDEQVKIYDDGDTEEAKGSGKEDQVVVPESVNVDDPPESVPEDDTAAPALPPRPKSKKSDFIELPSQEDAEAATKGVSAGTQSAQGADKKTWTSYLPTMPTLSKSSSKTSEKDERSWSEYASSMVPSSLPALSSLPISWSKSKDAKPEPVLNEDGSINEEATKEKEQKEISILLDNMNLSSINNRVFAFSEESQKLYERFVQVLKDTINGVPTAYDDMEKLMKEAGPTIERQWNAMPPFVQTLVKSLPAKLSGTMAPGMLAALGERPGNDPKLMSAALNSGEKGGNATAAATSSSKTKKKKKRQVLPGLKSLVKKKGLAATMLSNITTFLKTRFPFLLSATNVAMSLSVFILMFVFYYCWKRGREVRLAKEAEAGADGTIDDDEELEVDVSDEDDNDDQKEKPVETQGKIETYDKTETHGKTETATA